MSSTDFEKLLKEGFTIRPATMCDLEEIVSLFNTCSVAAIGVEEFRLDDMRSEWQLPGFDLNSASRIVLSPQGKLVGYIYVWDVANPPVHPWAWGCVHPEWERRGIGTSLMIWAQDRACQAIRRVPKDARVAMHCSTYSTHKPSKVLFEKRGFQLIRHFWHMVIELEQPPPPPPQWPKGITLQNYNPNQDAEDFYRVVHETFKDHWGYVDEPFEEGYKRWLHFITNHENYDPTLWFMAMNGDEIIGVARSRPRSDEDPDMGWISVLGVLRPWRDRGIGLALLQHTFGEFFTRGKRRVGLGVDADSLTGATRVYEKAGMHIQRQYDTYELELRPGIELRTEAT
jgi:mycothiol synthase